MTQAYPLQWPAGFSRTPVVKRKTARFHRQGGPHQQRLTIADGIARLAPELQRLLARNVVISSNAPTRRDGLPRSDARPDDPGVAVYFNLDGAPHCLPCDKWNRLADNIAAVAAHIDAIRAQERYGVGDLKHAFAGYKQLPPPDDYERAEEPPIDWRKVFGLEGLDPSPTMLNAVWRGEVAKAKLSGGFDEKLLELNLAKEAALKEVGA